ncbi:hypothetical protein BX616_010188 [Lobosporangium transversale]|uniref:RING-type E3 ubiquitin transferase n=1 Tax=Lobosporangium transversale TaxID=64571 RepID=A0A1Y2GMH3_9FUNG|nr:hypothetical protein BCR41DRAFT_353310 [Lobosporangium transversale]KAF9912987.1 hypothetical protein BX616_010188 [Lobosporangium transversale]ORZ15991.1 hypothetical protein BCR41DRAFT_353310 [Lobosporangium transversale]|eukprot:XP_021881338.1 hypothetical protein BCR41DRAFT_353310 [Lobosporangium transversale]
MEQHNSNNSKGNQTSQGHGSSNASAQTTTTHASTNDYWCHQCQREITPLMVPDPMCPHCHNEFVEKIEADNDPRTFIHPETQTTDDARGQHSNSSGLDGTDNHDDLFRLFQAFFNPQRAMMQQQQRQRQYSNEYSSPGQTYTSGTQFIFNPGSTSSTHTFVATSPGTSQHTSAHSPPRQDQSIEREAVGSESTNVEHDGQQQQHSQGPQWHSPPSLISGLLNRLGIEIHYTTDPTAFQDSRGFGAPFGLAMGGTGSGFFPIVSNPGDYAWGQGGLDDIISQMMEIQNRQNGPVGASDEIIDSIPHHTLTDEELEAKTECSVCKDEFTKEDNLLQLPCKHIFHEDCIKPWLKVSGTCPTCRFSLVGGNNGSTQGDHPSAPGNRGNGNSSQSSTTNEPRIPGAFPTATTSNFTQSNNNVNTSSSNPATTTTTGHSLVIEPLD